MSAERRRRLNGQLIDYIAPLTHFTDVGVAAIRRFLRTDIIEGEEKNTIDPLQRTYYERKKRAILEMTGYLSRGLFVPTETTVSRFLNIIDECLCYIKWEDSPYYDDNDKIVFWIFMQNIAAWARGKSEKLALRGQILDHIFAGDFPRLLNESWIEVEWELSQLEREDEGSIWAKLVPAVRVKVRYFLTLLGVVMNSTSETLTTQTCMKIYNSCFPSVLKCIDSVLVRQSAADSLHVEIIMDLMCVIFNTARSLQQELQLPIRQKFAQLCLGIIHSPTRTESQYKYALLAIAVCFTENEVKRKCTPALKLSVSDVTLLMKYLGRSAITGTLNIGSHNGRAWLDMETIRRFLLMKENRVEFVGPWNGDDDIRNDRGLISIVLKGVESRDKDLQKASLQVLKIIAEDPNLTMKLRTDKECLHVLMKVRQSPSLPIRQLAVDVMMKIMIKQTTRQVTRKMLEESGCECWTESDVRTKIEECGGSLPEDSDTTGCDGEWIIELLIARRENSEVFYGTIKNKLGIQSEGSVEFSRCLGKLEKLILSGDLKFPDQAELN